MKVPILLVSLLSVAVCSGLHSKSIGNNTTTVVNIFGRVDDNLLMQEVELYTDGETAFSTSSSGVLSLKAEQSTTFQDAAHDYSAERCIDGDRTTSCGTDREFGVHQHFTLTMISQFTVPSAVRIVHAFSEQRHIDRAISITVAQDGVQVLSEPIPGGLETMHYFDNSLSGASEGSFVQQARLRGLY